MRYFEIYYALFRDISLFRAILFNFEKKFQEMNESKIEPIRAPNQTLPTIPYQPSMSLLTISIFNHSPGFLHKNSRQFGSAPTEIGNKQADRQTREM